jgi:hypothetical protein
VYIILSVSFRIPNIVGDRLDAESRVSCANRNPFPLYRFLPEFTPGFPLSEMTEEQE